MGQVLEQAVQDDAESAGHGAWKVQAAFDSYTYWKHGSEPVRTDAAQKRMEYLRISQQVRGWFARQRGTVALQG